MAAVKVTQDSFEQEVLNSDKPVLVDFWAEWCGPCKMIAPIIDELAVEFEGKVKFCKANVDEVQQLATQYSVMSIPTLVFFKDGKPVDQVIGAQGKDQLMNKINQHVSA